MTERLLWAACPVCGETWSEALPPADNPDRDETFASIVLADLSSEARRHHQRTHVDLRVECGVVA